MRFARVVFSIVLIVSSMPITAAAEDVAIDEGGTVQFDSGESTAPIAAEPKDDLKIQAQAVAPLLVEVTQPRVENSPIPTKTVTLAPAIITEVQTAGTDEFIELYNPNDEPLPLTGLSLWYRGSGASVVQLVDLNSIVLQPKSFAVFGHVVAGAKPTANFAKASYSLHDTVGEVLIGRSASASDILDKVAWGNVSLVDGYLYDVKSAVAPPKNNSLQRCFLDGTIGISDQRDTSKEFLVYSNDLPTPFVGVACVVPDPPKPVNSCDGLRINEIAANTAEQFVELRNSTDHSVSLAGCQLQTNRSLTKSFTLGDETLRPGGFRTVYIKDTNITLTKTTSGIVYVLSSDGSTEVDAQAYTNLAANTSWARSQDNSWAQTYAITANAENVIQKYLPCGEGYERNVDTGRCNKIVVTALLADCGDGKYRSEETGRCRNVPVASILAACKLGQYRSEETNRCRNIVTASVQKPCKDNQYRSEETNRCRNLPAATVPDAAFAVQPIKDTTTAFIGWWALGGISLLAAGYGVWEWRDEIRNAAIRIASRFSAGK